VRSCRCFWKALIGASHREHGNHCRQDKLQYFDLSLLHIYGILRGMDRARAAFADLTALDRTALEALIVAQQEKLLSRDSEIEHLKLVIAKLRRMMFGTKSEKVRHEIEQLELRLKELEARESERSATTAALTDAKSKLMRRPLPEHLPREVNTHLPDEVACTQCGGELRKLGEDVSEMLEYVPASFKVIRPRKTEAELHEVRCDRRSSSANTTA
jgi:hypothetical protein